MAIRLLQILALTFVGISAFSGSDDKFIKKYAMMKVRLFIHFYRRFFLITFFCRQIYESCFGQEVVKQIRDEMKVAVAKCAVLELETEDAIKYSTTTEHTTTARPTTQIFSNDNVLPSSPNAIPISVQPLQDVKGVLYHESHDSRPAAPDDNTIKNTFDPDKLHQAILAYRPVSNFQQKKNN